MTKCAELANLIGNINAGGGGVNMNLIINGAMNVAQRATSATGLGASSGYFVCDRWYLYSNDNAGRLTMSQDSSVPTGKGFANSLKLACTTADTSVGTNEGLQISQKIESQNLQGFGKGTSEAKPFAVSFYVKGNASATYVCELMDTDNSNRHVGKTFNVTTDWTRVELTFPADTTGTFDDDNNQGLNLNIFLHSGSFNTSGTLQQTWGTLSQGDRGAGISSFFDSTSRTFFITGVQLEVGQNATEFEHEPFSQTLQKCLRYTFVHQTNVSYAFSALSGYMASSTNALTFYQYPVRMRAEPSLTTTGTFHLLDGHSSYSISGMSMSERSVISARVDVTSSGLTTGRVATIRNQGDSDAQIIFDAEL